MKLNRSLVTTLSALGVVSVSACGGGSSNKNETPADNGAIPPGGSATTPDGSGTTTTTTTANKDITLAGSLNLVGGTKLNLAASDSYDVYCVTFEDTPNACKATIDAEGKFNETCEDYAGTSFGCFLRKNNKTVGDIVFDLGTEDSDDEGSLVAGAGELKVAINFDPDLGVATALVDTTASSALAADKVAEVKAASGKADTTLPNMTGNYALQLLGYFDDDGKLQPPPADMKLGGGIPQTIHLNEYTEGNNRKVSIWQSEAAKNLCLSNGGSEQKPAFGAKVDDYDRVALNPANLKTYRDSMGKIVGQFAMKHPKAFKRLVDATSGQWEAKRCEQQKENAQNASQNFSASTCKIVSPPNTREVRYWDEKQKKEVVRLEPKWFNTWTEVSEAPEVGDDNIEARSQTCFNPNVGKPSGDNAFIPPCPPNVTDSLGTNPTGTFTVYDYVNGTERTPAQFLCKNPQEKDGLMFFSITAPASNTEAEREYLAASIADVKNKLNGPGGTDSSCDEISVAQMFDDESGTLGLASKEYDTGDTFGDLKVYKSNRRVILQTFSELLRNAGHDDDGGFDQCSQWKKPSDQEMASFNFNTSCADGRGGPICWGSQRTLQSLGLKVAAAGNAFESISNESNASFQPFLPPEVSKLCPNFVASITPEVFNSDRPNQGETFEDFKTRKRGYRNDCAQEFTGLSFATQVSKLYDGVLDPSRKPPAVVLSCAENSEDIVAQQAIAALESVANNSCMPELQIDFRCEGGKDCTEVLRCWGTEDGNCVAADGTFVGRVPNRFETTTLKLGTEGAFNLTSLTKETWKTWSEKGEKVCRAARGFKIAGVKKADAPFTFEGSLNSKSTQKCDGDSEEKEAKDGGGPDRLQLKFTKQ